ATHFVDGATDLIALAREGLEAAREGAEGAPDPGAAAPALLRCQERYNTLAEMFQTRLASYGRLRRLLRFGRGRGPAWRDGAAHVRKALGRCRGVMGDVNRALFASWQEVTDRVASVGLRVQATNIGQQISVPTAAAAAEAMT